MTDVYEMAAALLTSMGVDVAHALERAEDAREAEASRVRAAARRCRDLAIDVKQAERKLLYQAQGFNAGAAGFTSADLRECEERVNRLRDAYGEACCWDRDMMRQLRREVA